ncbi:sensor histidine kinase [Hyphococcus sp.]|uniref:sensor histidine kinase n=1 Tax=Hyphococcus sp. TaxID=2038636 RepID=UPI0035C75B32
MTLLNGHKKSAAIARRGAPEATRPYWLFGTILAICVIAQFFNYRILLNAGASTLSNWNLILICFLDFLPWLLLAPAIIAAARRYSPISVKPVLLFHLPLSVVCAVAVLVVTTITRFYLEPTESSFAERLHRRLFLEFTWTFVFYWFLVGTVFMTTYHFEYRKKAENELRLIAEKAALEKELFSTKLDALHQQFKPHFLFNALHTVSALMETDVVKARSALIAISRLLRTALQFNDVEKHSLSAELNWLKDYVALEQLRYARNLSLEINSMIDAELYSLPPMILQPLVENAIRHGAVKTEKGGRILLLIQACNEGLSVFIDDDGQGFSDDAPSDGFGIGLVRDRLRLTYGVAAKLSFETSPLGGARAVLLLPETAQKTSR